MAFDYASKIQALIANAEDESLTPEARAAYREKAERLMRDYRIAEEDLIAQDQFAAVPVIDRIAVMESNAATNPMRHDYWRLLSFIASHCGVRARGEYSYGEGSRFYQDTKLEAVLVGYEGDIAYAKFLWTAARLVFMTRIDARVDRTISDQLNCYFMRGSGMSRKDIAADLWGAAPTDGAAHGRVQKLYATECAERGEAPKVSGRGIRVDVYREAYAKGFVDEFYWRMSKAHDAAGEAGAGLVLHGRKERVDEAFYAEYPDARPVSQEEWERRDRERQEDLDNCEACKRTKSKTGRCKRHQPYQLPEAERKRQERRESSAEARAGYATGERAARSVDVARGFERKARAEAAPERGAIEG